MVAFRSRASPLIMLLGAILFFSSQVLAISAVLGVDLGTEYIKAALVKPGIPLDIVLTKDSRRKETSAVAFKPSRGGPQEGQFPERLYGSDAMALSARFPSEVYPNLKTLLGLTIDDPVVQEYAARYPALQLQTHDVRGTAAFKSNAVTADQEAWLVEELLAMQLQSVQKNAELAAGDGTTVRSIVLTVPPFFTTDEKRAIQSAAELAGFKVLSLISDGLAVGLNYATSRVFPNINEGAKPEYHMVFDMGAGSTKASVMKFQSRNVKDIGKFNKTIQEVQLMGSGWDRTLGGDNLNTLIVNDMITQFVDSKGAKKVSATEVGIRGHGRAMAKLNKEAERVRHVLSANQKTGASFEGLYEDVDFKYQLSRADFEVMSEAHAQRVAVTIHDALKKAGLDIGDLDSVILHGGASRTPFVQKALEKIVGSPDRLRSNVNSDEAAVFGAGFRAAELSPSFRVKEIRVSEGSAYPIGMSWMSGGQEQSERIWSAVSPIGGPAKEYTFTEDKDFTATFWQQVGDDHKDVKTFTTKNLTATMASFKEAHPTCADQGPQFRITAKLNSENGEIEITRAAVGCEVVVKEGFVDGVKNLFGFGKKDQEPLEEGEDAKPEPADDKDAKADASSAAAESASAKTADAESTGSSEELKPEVQKLEVVSIPVDITVSNLGIPELTKDQLSKTKDRLKAFTVSDRARLAREEALNKLEGFTYRVRDLLEDEAFIAASTEVERTNLGTKSSTISEWLYDDGAEATKDELKAKLKELQDLASPIQKRSEESAKRPELLTKLKDTLSKTFEFLDATRKSISDYDKWHADHPAESADAASSAKDPAETPADDFVGLEDDAKAPTMEDVLEERGPVPPLYKLEDLVDLEKLSKTTDEWLKELEPKQDSLPSTADPVLLIKDLEAKLQKIESMSKELSLKSVRNFMGKSKKTEKEKKKPKKANNNKAQEKQSIKVGDQSFTAEELEEMINNMSEGDWEKVSEDFKREEAAKHKPKEASGHDEL
ncbi:Hsp70 protein-domain-containing protein [Emericellopsis atlantica]|uniref:Hsp70 protein-domain-containing protein n=1 Tax=Emericellopsis atlantica TaxID=2614577 RepID=A0A9P7ZTU1_9HYPO|nr:Hsp70 protein-domain-containing protein [Emericellopsis atlantica]KAG9257692.1 Hsp70 protein-domain-containing protein [Emericellopsis atlantica]